MVGMQQTKGRAVVVLPFLLELCCVPLTEFCSLAVNELAVIERWAVFMVCVTEVHGT